MRAIIERLRGAMHKQGLWFLLCVFALLIAFGLTACMEILSTPQVPTLIFGEVVVVGDHGELLLSVANMPESGLAAIEVDVGGILYDAGKISNVTLEGLYGFAIVVEQFAGGVGAFLAVQPSSGLPGGGFIRMRFDVTGNVSVADFQFIKAEITLADDDGQAFDFELTSAQEYYAM